MNTHNARIYLSPAQLAARYSGNLSLRSLERMRAAGDGPRFLKLQRKVMYALQDVETWEAQRMGLQNTKAA